MSKRAAFVTAAVVLLLGWAHGGASGILATLSVAVIYIASLRLHPRTRHTGFRGCGGSGEHHSSLFPWTHRKDPKCQGGRIVRHGARVLGSPPVRSEWRGFTAARKQRKTERSWR